MKAIRLPFFLVTACTTSCLSGGVVTPVASIAKFSGNCSAAITYTFDDGLRDQYTAAIPMLNELGLKGTFFIIAGKVSDTVADAEKRKNDKRAWGTITWAELNSMAAQGHEIASHTWSHPNLTKVSSAEVESEMARSYDAIKTHTGKPPLTLAFPFNASSPEIQSNALQHYLACRTFQVGTGAKTTAASLDAWADRLVQDQKWGVLMTHAITNGYAAMTSSQVLFDHWKYVISRQHDIWVDTFADVARYEKERDNTQLTLIGTAGSVTLTLTNTLNPILYDVPLTVVIDAPGAMTANAERSPGDKLPVRILDNAIQIQAAPYGEPITVTWK